MFTGLHHANIIVSDLERAKRFYTEVLGLQVAMETEIDEPEFARGVGIPGTRVRAIFFSVPNTPTVIEMFEYTAPRKSRPKPDEALPSDIGIGHLAFQVSDIDAVHRRLREQGVPFVSEPVTIPPSHKTVGGVRFCYFKDPDGTLLELIYLPRPDPMFLACLLVYLAVMVGIGIYFAGRNRTLEDFVLAKRSVGLVPLLFTTWVANFGGGAIVGWTGGFYRYGIDWWWLPLGFVAALIVVNLFLVERVRALPLFTVPDLLGQRYGPRPRGIAATLSIVIGTMAIAFQILAFAGLLTVLTGISLRTGTVLAALVFMSITMSGGLAGLVITDILQGTVTLVGLPIAALLVLWQAGGPWELWARLPAAHTSLSEFTYSGRGFGEAFAVFGTIATSQVLIQKVLAARDTPTARRVVFWLIPTYLFTYVALYVLGAGARVLLGAGLSADAVVGQVIKSKLPLLLAAVLVATLLGKIVTSANAVLMGVGSNIARDVYQPLRHPGSPDRSVLVIRLAIAGIALCGMALALVIGDVLRMMLVTFWVAGVALLVPLYGGYLWKRGTPAAASAGMLAGTAGVLISSALAPPATLHPTLVGFAVSLVVYVLVSALSIPKAGGQAGGAGKNTFIG